ncbi:MAG: hypothetical protein GXZ11_02495 [Tissierellia bacterium]|nr:hypothetical protein [Tissierellia bacterium]
MEIIYNPVFDKLENDHLCVNVLRDFGAKVVSLRIKEKDMELLFQPSLGYYHLPEKHGDFAKFDTSGWDECIPSIDVTSTIPDHGEIWSRQWENQLGEDYIINRIELETLPLIFTRKLILLENKLIAKYSVENIGSEKVPFLWAQHGLYKIYPNMEMILPDNLVVQVDGPLDLPQNIKNIADYTDTKAYKWYMDSLPENIVCGYLYKEYNLAWEMSFSGTKLPYLGCWINKGGFKGEYNIALEPSNGYYDSLEKALENNRVQYIDSKEIIEFEINYEIKYL